MRKNIILITIFLALSTLFYEKSEKYYFNADSRRCNADSRRLICKKNLRKSALDLRKSAFMMFFNNYVYAQNFTNRQEKIIISPPAKTLNIGETLEYSVEWLGIAIGRIILNVQGIEEIDGNECYHITARATPNKFFSKLYDIEYIVNSYIDKNNFYTHRFEKTRRVKDKFSYVVADFDRKNKEVKYKTKGSGALLDVSPLRKGIENSVPTSLKIINGAQDLFSSLYYLRLLEMDKNQTHSINIHYDQRNWVMNLRVEKPFFRDIRNLGSFAVFAVSLDSNLGEFILGKRNILVYFTTDSRRIPVEFKFGTGIGTIRGVIKKITP